MNVFISWSGPRSKQLATALREWLPRTIQRVRPWMSSADIDAGTQWQASVSGELANAKVGILCVTAENVEAPWLLFEAGALAKSIDEAPTRVIPVLLDHQKPTDIQGPLTQFQVVLADREGIGRVLASVNSALGNEAMPSSEVSEILDTWWPKLEPRLQEARSTTVEKVIAACRYLDLGR